MQQDDCSSSDDNIPLAKLCASKVKGRKTQSVKRKLIEEECFSDDSVQDASYNPNKDDINSTDSEADELVLTQKKIENTAKV